VSKGSKIPKLTQLTQDNTSSSDLMGQLLVKTGQFRGGVVVGQKVEGKVVEVTGRMVILDIGSKAEGLVVEDQFDEARDFIKTLSAGDKVTATVVVSETMHGQALLSLRDTAQETGWVELENAFKENGFPADDNEKMVEIVTKFKSDVEATNEIIEIVKSCEEESTKTM